MECGVIIDTILHWAEGLVSGCRRRRSSSGMAYLVHIILSFFIPLHLGGSRPSPCR